MGYAGYSALSLLMYDPLVLRFSNRFLWRCGLHELRALYQRNVSASHLDVGVGTGYFLDVTQFPVARPAITLLDANPACLKMAARRISRHRPRLIQANLLAPMPPIGPFSSVGACYLLHCVPGDIPAKAIMFDHLRSVMRPAARIFGATLVQGASRSWAAQRLMALYNTMGIFSNAQDTAEDLEAELAARFCEVKVWMRGSVALFEAQRA